MSHENKAVYILVILWQSENTEVGTEALKALFLVKKVTLAVTLNSYSFLTGNL